MGLGLPSRTGYWARVAPIPICLRLPCTGITHSQRNLSSGTGAQVLMLARQALSLQSHVPCPALQKPKPVQANFIWKWYHVLFLSES